jgi:hypothetical protein
MKRSLKGATVITHTKSKLTTQMREQGFLPCSEVAKKVGVHRATVYRWIRGGVVEHMDFSGAYYVKWSSVVQHLGRIANVLGLVENTPNEKTDA